MDTSRRSQQASKVGGVSKGGRRAEWAEWQAIAEIQSERLHKPPFISSVVSSGVTTRSDALSPELCTPFGPRNHAARLPIWSQKWSHLHIRRDMAEMRN